MTVNKRIISASNDGSATFSDGTTQGPTAERFHCRCGLFADMEHACPITQQKLKDEIERLTRELAFERSGTDSLQRQVQDRGEEIERLTRELADLKEQRRNLQQDNMRLRMDSAAPAQPEGAAAVQLLRDCESLLTMHDRSKHWLNERDALLVRLRSHTPVETSDSRDTARYRWLRDQGPNKDITVERGFGPVYHIWKEELDSAIDAALTGQQLKATDNVRPACHPPWFDRYQALVSACALAGFRPVEKDDPNFGGKHTVLEPLAHPGPQCRCHACLSIYQSGDIPP